MSRILLHLAVCALCSVSAVAQNKKDAATYAPTATGEQLTNLYLNSALLNGGQPVLPGGVAGDARGMATVNVTANRLPEELRPPVVTVPLKYSGLVVVCINHDVVISVRLGRQALIANVMNVIPGLLRILEGITRRITHLAGGLIVVMPSTLRRLRPAVASSAGRRIKHIPILVTLVVIVVM